METVRQILDRMQPAIDRATAPKVDKRQERAIRLLLEMRAAKKAKEEAAKKAAEEK